MSGAYDRKILKGHTPGQDYIDPSSPFAKTEPSGINQVLGDIFASGRKRDWDYRSIRSSNPGGYDTDYIVGSDNKKYKRIFKKKGDGIVSTGRVVPYDSTYESDNTLLKYKDLLPFTLSEEEVTKKKEPLLKGKDRK